jgi:predicted phage baseplate assembly protein
MPLPVPKLDSRDWEELVVESRSLLPRAAPEWTDHNLHDPGITLLELFAWLTELLLYRSDRVSPAMQRAFLRLVGVVPRPPQAARTVVTIGGVPAIAEGTQLADASATPLFETTRTLTPTPARLVALQVESGGVRTDRTVDNGRGLPPFGAAPVPGDALLLGFDGRPVAPGAELSLHIWTPTWIDDDGERARLEDEWTAVVADCHSGPPPSWPTRAQCAERTPALAPTATLPDWWRHYGVTTVWEHQDGAEWAPLEAEDETRALTLAGAVRLIGPASHPVDSSTGRWWIRCRVAAGRYECPPRILAVAVNAVPARHAVAAPGPEQLGTTRGEAGRTVTLRHRPVLAGSTALRFGADASWIEVSEWDTCGPDDRCYRLDPAAGTIELGNGRRGRVPPAGTAVEATAYRTGGGSGGNLRAGTLVAAAGVATAVVGQPYAAQGGTDAEPLGRAHGRALDLLGRAARGVTVADFERLALDTPGVPVGRARAIAGHHPSFPCLGAEGCVTVVVLPRCGTPPGAAFVAAVRRYLERRRPLTVELHVSAPDFEPLQVRATLVVAPGDSAGVAAAGEDALRDFFDPIAGGPEGGGWPFGRDVLESEVLAVLAGVDGVLYADDLMLARGDRCAPTCGNLESCPTALVELRAVALTVTEETRP